MFRSKSRSQMGAGGGPTTTSPSPRPVYSSSSSAAAAAAAAAVANSSTNATNAIVKNILKNVESHVRVMSHLGNVSISSSYTALRLRKPRGKLGGGDQEEEWSTPFSVSRVHKGAGGDGASSSSSSQRENTSTFAFYSDVVAPCVSNCCAGQSYLFLVTGPQESGRSQTLYGCPSKPQSKGTTPNPSQDPRLYPDAGEDGNERGVVELAAIDFLERVAQRQHQRMEAEDAELACQHKSTQESEKENRGVPGGQRARLNNNNNGGLVVTFSAFTTRGDQIIDTITREEVKIEAFPPPLGSVALPYMHLLDDQSIASFSFLSSSSGKSHPHHHRRQAADGSPVGSVVPILPEKKYIDTSCIIQFQVYACVDGGGGNSSNSSSNSAGAGLGKRTMATFTFVDMAAFRAPLCKEVTSVVSTVRKVAGLAGAGEGGDTAQAPPSSSQQDSSSQSKSDPNTGEGVVGHFSSTKLTQLLEPALTGYVTLVSVTTISGREDLYDGACAALAFAQDIKRIHQVFFLLHIFTPRWLFETGCALENLREERERVLKGSYARGVYDYYQTASKWLASNVGDVEGQLEKLLAETATIRQGIEREVQGQEVALQERIGKEEGLAKKASEDAARALQRNNAQFETVKRLDEEIAQVEQKISHSDLKTSQRIGEMRIEISALEARKSSREKEVAQLAREKALFEGKSEEVVSVVRKYAEDLAFSQVSYSCHRELRAIGQKRRRLEDDLQMACVVAHTTTDLQRSDRARQAIMTRLSTTQQRVESLRQTVRSSLSGNAGLREALAGFVDDKDGDDFPGDDSHGGMARQTRKAGAPANTNHHHYHHRPRRGGQSSASPASRVPMADSP